MSEYKRWDEKFYLSNHKRVKFICENRMVEFPVMYEQTFKYSGADEEEIGEHLIILALNEEQYNNIKDMTINERVKYIGPKIFVHYGSTIAVD